MRKRKQAHIDGSTILYHFLQKDLNKSDIWLFQMLCARLVTGLGIWLDPSLYQKMPVLLPFVVRDQSCRKRKEGDVEAWGTPNEHGYLRDDNSLVKSIPKALTVTSPSQPLYDGRRIGRGFVAAHVWRQTEGALSVREPWTNSFVPNLVWLPEEVARLSDREGDFTQQYLQALSAKIYKDIQVTSEMRPFVDRAWRMLKVPSGIPAQGLPDAKQLSFFRITDDYIRKKRLTLESVVRGYKLILNGQRLPSKLVTTRYGSGLKLIAQKHVRERISELDQYLSAIAK